jgi:GGDEF domain-containing protein
MRLKHTTREDDTISRFGGDEFLCVLTQLHEKSEVAMIAGKLLKGPVLESRCSPKTASVRVRWLNAQTKPCMGPKRANPGLHLHNRSLHCDVRCRTDRPFGEE